MGSTQQLKRRIGSVKNTRQITKAMQLVAASKMRRAQQRAQASRPYRESAQQILSRLSSVSDVKNHPLFVRRKVDSRLLLIITSDTGLAGAYDGNVLKRLTAQLQQDHAEKIGTKVIALGKKGANFVSRLEGVDLLGVYPIFSGQPQPADIRPIVDTILEQYASGDVDAVTIIYTQYITSIRQEVAQLQLLPASVDEKPEWSPLEVAIFEPSVESIVESVVERLIELEVWQAILESLASEHSMRMIAMKNATDNAGDIIDDLTLAFNTARQGAITQQIAEIVGGAEAITE